MIANLMLIPKSHLIKACYMKFMSIFKKIIKKMTEVKKKQAKIGPFSKFRQFRSIVKIHV